MGTLLAVFGTTALIGDSSGNVQTEVLPVEKYGDDIERWVYLEYQQAGHTDNDAEYINAPRSGRLRDTDNINKKILEINEEPIPIKTYTDEPCGLSVRAAFDPQTRNWVVADLETSNS